MAKNKRTRSKNYKSKPGFFSRFKRVAQKQITLPLFLALFAAVGVYLLTRIDALSISKFPLKTDQASIINRSPAWCYKNTTYCHHNYPAADIFANSGTTVLAAVSGTVTRVCDEKCASYNGRVAIRGTDGLYYAYYHLAPTSIPPSIGVGQSVDAGVPIGKVGTSKDTGNGSPSHLHFQITKGVPPSCEGASCPDSQFIDPQSALTRAFKNLPSGTPNPPPASGSSAISINKTDPRGIYGLRVCVEFKISGHRYVDWEDPGTFNNTRNMLVNTARGYSRVEGQPFCGNGKYKDDPDSRLTYYGGSKNFFYTQSSPGGHTIYIRDGESRTIEDMVIHAYFYINEAPHYDWFTVGDWTGPVKLQLDARNGYWKQGIGWRGDFLRRE